jgi:hypothetical protein
MMTDPVQAAEETPIACKLTGEERAERGDTVKNLFDETEEVRELDDGYAFRFAGSNAMAARLLAFTLDERRCCPFFTFELVFTPNEGNIWVQLRGSAAIKEFVASAWGKIIAAHA